MIEDILICLGSLIATFGCLAGMLGLQWPFIR